MSRGSLLSMQRSVGNAYVSRLVADRRAAQITGAATPVQRDSTDVHAELTGHASPRWEHTHGGDRSELNMQLSEDRVESVRMFFEEMLRRELSERGVDATITYQSRNVDEPAPVDSPDSASLSADARGSTATEQAAGGDTRADDPGMRRVDVTVTVTWHVTDTAPSSEAEQVTVPAHCEENASDQWAVKMSLSGGAGHAGVGGAFAIGELKNKRTGQTAQGTFVGGGLGVGLSTPGADPGWGDWTDFTTDRPVTFEDFDDTLSRLTTLGAGVAIVGYSAAFISWPLLGADSIYVGGFNMGALGADGGTNVGNWTINGTPPGPECTPEHTELRERVRQNEFDVAMPNEFRTRVLFDTGSPEISDAELAKLEQFVDGVMANYEYSGAQETRAADSAP